jgi:hypothetical protein
VGVWCVDQLDLAAVVAAISCSRHFVRVTLTKWGAAHVLDDALLVATDLVINAVQATGIIEPDPRWGDLESPALLRVRLIGLDASVIIEVCDVSPEEPRVTAASPDDERGHGLAIVRHLARSWVRTHTATARWCGRNSRSPRGTKRLAGRFQALTCHSASSVACESCNGQLVACSGAAQRAH